MVGTRAGNLGIENTIHLSGGHRVENQHYWHGPAGAVRGRDQRSRNLAIFLASDLASYVTGTIVMADCGYRAI